MELPWRDGDSRGAQQLQSQLATLGAELHWPQESYLDCRCVSWRNGCCCSLWIAHYATTDYQKHLYLSLQVLSCQDVLASGNERKECISYLPHHSLSVSESHDLLKFPRCSGELFCCQILRLFRFRHMDVCFCFLTFFCLFLFIYYFLTVLGFELRASWLLGRHLSHSASPVLCWIFFKIRSGELFAWAGLELWSFWSLPPV
jgi:hypothetical protein